MIGNLSWFIIDCITWQTTMRESELSAAEYQTRVEQLSRELDSLYEKVLELNVAVAYSKPLGSLHHLIQQAQQTMGSCGNKPHT